MIIRILLWLIVLLNSFHFAAHLYDLMTGIPNWKSGEPDAMARYRDFHHKGKKSDFFAPVIFASIIISALTLLFVWNEVPELISVVSILFIIPTIIFISVMTVFGPINNYFEQNEYDPVHLKLIVKRWITLDKIRLVIVLASLLLSIYAFEKFNGN